ncbi:MAG: rRNA maturation RNase YbeY [Ignavibacteriae bacterium]|nr:MAG: rRNA maturation RNase YbeY [Ignavibacteriota bacterium]
MTSRMIILSTNHPQLRFPYKEVFRVVKIVAQEEGKKIPALAVIWTHRRFIRTINKKFLAHDYDTDVIAFPLGDDGGVEAEIYINLDAARNQAKIYHVTYREEARRLLVHGILHVLGYDDQSPRNKKRMRAREDHLVARMSEKTRMS